MSSSTSFPERKEYNLLKVLSGTFAEAESKDFSQPIDESECAENYGYCSDSDLEPEDDDDAVKEGETLKKTVTLRGHPFDPLCFSANEDMPTYGQHKGSAREGAVIRVQDIAFITCVFLDAYCHATDDLADFRPFYFIYIPVPSSLHHLDRRRTESQGVPRSLPCRRTRYLGHHQSRSIVSQIRSAPFFVVRTLE